MAVHMIITHISGGLGNQMLQYAVGRCLAMKFNVQLKLDISWYINDFSRKFMLNAFPCLSYETAGKSEVTALRYKPASFFRRLFHSHGPYAESYIRQLRRDIYWAGIEDVAPPAYLLGSWHNEKYFTSIADTIRREFTFPPLHGEAYELGKRIAGMPGSVAVHVRRGDFVSGPHDAADWEKGNPAYYSRAMSAIAELVRNRGEGQAEFFVVSDEPQWVREYFDSGGIPFTVVDSPPPHTTMNHGMICT
jgi:hypothetical protein